MLGRRTLVNWPVVGHALVTGYRLSTGLGYVGKEAGKVARWLLSSNETTNFTYDLTPYNVRCLIAFLADVLDFDVDNVRRYVRELMESVTLQSHVRDLVARSQRGKMADPVARYGRRIGWYVIARALKPRVIVETGVDKGLGSCVLCEALMVNRSEGYGGQYFGTDLNPNAGYLLAGKYRDAGKLLIGDSVKSLLSLEDDVDLFVSDSDHSEAYERSEYAAVAPRLSARAVVLGDNSRWTAPLLDFSNETGRSFALFYEEPLHHWYPGGGLGIARFKPTRPFQEMGTAVVT